MRLAVFTKHQQESKTPFMCINPDHEMALVPFMTEDLNIELKCFFPACTYKITPGLMTYTDIINGKIK